MRKAIRRLECAALFWFQEHSVQRTALYTTSSLLIHVITSLKSSLIQLIISELLENILKCCFLNRKTVDSTFVII